ncbi:ABC transporter substrate-binding protein [Geotoga petraea]|uniref:Extracellular solute-binding protein n=1 Tax=Geotoga petraea TaxID=28234 RepID=A0A4Z0VZM8_9BACT|nr:extracellular solute-binding protein [Geotoga petraea]TGG87547.1 extracellular solute-binding protein [Geotoga petraea]
MKKLTLTLTILTLVLFVFSARTLVINSYMSDPAPKEVFSKLVADFEEMYPEIDVTVNTFAHEDFKTLLRTWLGSNNAPDVVTWFAGERMRYFAEKGFLEPLDDIFPNGFEEEFPEAFRTASAYQDNIYFIPQSWYWWGVYYNKAVFKDLSLEIPKTWNEFMAVNETLKENGKIPMAIGTKFLWTAGGWFDYLNMRINGIEFHTEFTAGKVPFTDPRVKKVFEYWKEMVDKGYFINNHSAYSWQEAANRLFTGEAGMYLMGQFIKDVAPENVKDDIDFFRFPIIDSNVGVYEDTPIDGFMVPKNAKNIEDAKLFMKYIAGKESQQYFADELGRLAANKKVTPPDAHAQAGMDMILESDGVMQFFDRDMDPEMANNAMNGFVEFMMFPNRIDAILENLENIRQRIYN